MSDDSRIVRLEERMRGMAASTAILQETAKNERERIGDSLEDRRKEIITLEKGMVETVAKKATKSDLEELRLALARLRQEQASATQVKVAMISAAGAVIAAVVALLRSLVGG